MTEPRLQADLRTRAFARVIGPYMAIFPAVLAIRLPDMTEIIDNLFANPASVWILSAMMMGGGLVIVGGHRNWRGPAAIVISLFGWFVLVRGVGLIASTTTVQDAVDTATLEPALLTAARVFFAILALVGLWLTYVGWFARPATTPHPSLVSR